MGYLALAAGILFMNNLLLQSFLIILHMPVYPAKILTECTLFCISWFIQKKVIFRNERECYIPLKRERGGNL